MASIPENTNHERERKVLGSVLDDLTNLHAAIKALTAKLDTDGGVTGDDYASSVDPDPLTTTNS